MTWIGGNGTWAQPDGVNWTATYNSGSTAIFSGSATGTVTITAGGVTPGQTNVTGGSYTLSGGPLGGSGGIAKSGAGTLTLTGSNSYSGTTSITAGVLNIQNAFALGGTAAGTTVASGAALQIQGGITVTNESLSIAGRGPSSLGALRNVNSANQWTGVINAAGSGTITAAGDVSLHNGIHVDAGSLTLSGSIVIGQPASATEASTILASGDGNLLITGPISGGKAGQSTFIVSSSGTGTRTLSGSNAYLGWTVINRDLRVEGGAAIPDSSRVILGGGGNGRFTLNASETIGGLASSLSTSVVDLGVSTLTIGADNTTPLATDIGGVAYAGTIIGTGAIVKVGSGTLTLSASNAYSGGTTLSAGTLAVSNSAALGSGAVAVNGGVLSLRSNLAVGALSGSGGTVSGGTAGSFVVTASVASGTSTYSGVLADGSSTAIGLTKQGAGTLTLAGGAANTATGATLVTAGALNLAKTSGNAIGGDLTLSGGNVTLGGNNQIADSASIVISSGTLNPLVQQITETISSLSITGGRFNAGVSNWTITGAGSFTGGTGAIFQGNSGSRSSFGSLSLVALTATADSAENGFHIYGNNSTLQTTVTVGSGGLTLNGSRVNLYRGTAGALGSRLVLNGDLTTTGAAVSSIAEGTGVGSTGAIAVELSSTAGSVSRSFTIGGGGANLNVLVPITNGSATTAGIRKLGAGILTLGTANTYTGATTIAAGTLALGAGGSFANSPTITVGDAGSSGAVLDLTAKTGTFAFTSGQTVGGIGTLRMDTGDTARFDGTFAPGTSPGIFTFDGGTALLAGTTQIEVLGSARGTGYDAVDLLNSATLNYGSGVLALDFGSWLGDQQSYQLFGNGSSSLLGGFSSVTIAGSNYAGLTFTGSNGVWTSQGTSPANQTLTFTEATGTLVIVPEPAGVVLAVLGMAAAALASRRRTATQTWRLLAVRISQTHRLRRPE